MEKKITLNNLRVEVNKVLAIAPNLNSSEVWLALMKKYPYSAIEKIMDKIDEEKVEKLRNMDAEITVVDDNGNEVSLEEYIHDKEQKRQK